MEQHLAASDADMYGLECGDSRYFAWRYNWCALGGMDRFVRPHTTKSLVDYAQNKSPGEIRLVLTLATQMFTRCFVTHATRSTLLMSSVSPVSLFISKAIPRHFSLRHWSTPPPPIAVPPDDDTSGAPASDAALSDVPTPTASAPTPTPSVLHICNTTGCQRRSQSDPSGAKGRCLLPLAA